MAVSGDLEAKGVVFVAFAGRRALRQAPRVGEAALVERREALHGEHLLVVLFVQGQPPDRDFLDRD